ncbi:hypothetical protein K501DRAFT_282449 [Backusella circina FSU 941]|nr:hypothetical protein K501DRAFT_282449 [Backusella circina FSU 941]
MELQTLDEHLRCPICKEFFDTAMILSTCSHSFCALCIRRSLTAEQICPKCRKPSYENNLHNNYDLDNVVETWKQARAYLVDLEGRIDKGKNKAQSIIPSSQIQLERQLERSTISCEYEPSPIIPASTPTVDDDDFRDTPTSSASASTSMNSTILSNNHLTRRSTRLGTVNATIESQKKAQEEEQLKSTSIVTCPICEQEMKYSVLEIHLDRCMKGDSSIPKDTFTTEKMRIPSILKSGSGAGAGSSQSGKQGKKPTKVVYALKNEKQMRDILKDLGLPDHGDKALKIWRHKEYINIYEANADSSHPAAFSTLRKRLEDNEQYYLSSKNNQAKRKDNDLTEYNQKYSGEFSKLVDGIKRRKTEKNQ